MYGGGGGGDSIDEGHKRENSLWYSLKEPTGVGHPCAVQRVSLPGNEGDRRKWTSMEPSHADDCRY